MQLLVYIIVKQVKLEFSKVHLMSLHALIVKKVTIALVVTTELLLAPLAISVHQVQQYMTRPLKNHQLDTTI
jgi:hypothetical protein